MSARVKITGARLIATASLALVLLQPVPSHAADPGNFAGIWLSDQRDGAVEIMPCGEQLCGYIYAILHVPDPDLPLADNRNQDPALRARPLCGLQVMGGLQRRVGAGWGDGWVYDPNVGKTFGLEIALADRNTLSVHGYAAIALLGRTVLWTRVTEKMPRCTPPRPPPR